MMRKCLPPNLFKALATICFCCLCNDVLAEDSKFPIQRVITDQKGRKLDVTILGLNGNEVALRRSSDGKEFTLDLSSLSDADKSFIGNLGSAGSREIKSNSSEAWEVDDFGEKLIFPGSADQLSLALGKNGAFIACADTHNVQLIHKTTDTWNSILVHKFENVSKESGIQIKLAISDDGQPHIVYCLGERFDGNVTYTTQQNGSWFASSAKASAWPFAFGDIFTANGGCKIIRIYRGYNTDVFECDKSSVNQALKNGGHFMDAKFTSDGKVFGVSRWLPMKDESMNRLHFSEILKVPGDNRKNEIVKTFEQTSGKIKYLSRVATDRNGAFSAIYSSENEFFHSTRAGNKEGTGLIEGNWKLNDYVRSEFGFSEAQDCLVGYEMANSGISYMLYNAANGNVHIARFNSDGQCVIDNMGKGKAISLSIDSEGNPHILYHTNDGLVNYARFKVDPVYQPEAGKKLVIRDARQIKSITPLQGYINHAEKKSIPDESAANYPTAKPVPNKEGFVFSPYGNKVISVSGAKSGELVADPNYPSSEKKYFRVP